MKIENTGVVPSTPSSAIEIPSSFGSPKTATPSHNGHIATTVQSLLVNFAGASISNVFVAMGKDLADRYGTDDWSKLGIQQAGSVAGAIMRAFIEPAVEALCVQTRKAVGRGFEYVPKLDPARENQAKAVTDILSGFLVGLGEFAGSKAAYSPHTRGIIEKASTSGAITATAKSLNQFVTELYAKLPGNGDVAARRPYGIKALFHQLATYLPANVVKTFGTNSGTSASTDSIMAGFDQFVQDHVHKSVAHVTETGPINILLKDQARQLMNIQRDINVIPKIPENTSMSSDVSPSPSALVQETST